MKDVKKHRAIIDRIENDIAVLLVGEEEEVLEINKSFLPAGIEEGDILTIKITAQKNRTKKAKEKVAEMIKKLRAASS